MTVESLFQIAASYEIQRLKTYSSLFKCVPEGRSPIYARANIAEYWILDIVGCRVYIFRNPSNEGYQSTTVINQDAAIELLAFPEIEIPFSELLLS